MAACTTANVVSTIVPNETRTSTGRLIYRAERGGVGELHLCRASYGPHGLGARLNYTTIDSPFGLMLFAATPHGVSWIGVSDSEAYLEEELRLDLRAAEIVRDDRAITPIARQIVDFLLCGTTTIDLSIDIRGTQFQCAVWRELCAIPWGETRSYGEIARRLGRPEASRAVGHANGSNPLAIVIPCHRAVGSDGGLTGYRWGVEYKRRLLEHECTLAQLSMQFG